MMRIWTRTVGKVAWVAVLAVGLSGSVDAGTLKVFANDQNTGDNFQGGAPIDLWIIQFENPKNQAIVNSGENTGWSYANVQRTDTYIGINGDLPRDGNGSVHFQSGGSSASKADIAFNLGGAAGLLTQLTSLSYDYIRTGGQAAAHFAPAIRIEVTAKGKTGYLVWEPVYNDHPSNDPIDLNVWYHGDAIGGKFWASNGLGIGNGNNTFQNLTYWSNVLGSNAMVTGIEVGIGSGWGGSFTGAADNIAFGFDNQSTTYNFEVSPTAAVPEPGSIAMGLIAGGFGLAAAAWRRRRVG